MYSKVKAYISQFIELSDQEWAEKEKLLIPKSLKKGELLLTEGQVCNFVSFVNEGYFRVFRLVDDKEVTVNFFFENSIASDYISFITRQPAKENIEALRDAEVLQLSYDSMQQLREQTPAFERFGRIIAEKSFIALYKRSNALLYKKPEELYLELRRQRPKIIERIPQYFIASYLGITPEYLSRIRSQFAQKKG
jgi:CRP-like cAMP-binding protein